MKSTKKGFVGFLVVMAALLVFNEPAKADSIGPNCGTCQGSIYTLTYALETAGVYDITLTIDTSGYSGGGVLLDQVAVKVSSSVPALTTTLDSAPGGIGNWTVIDGGLNSSGCDGHGSGFECATANSLGFAASVPGDTYSWTFDIKTSSLLTGTNQASIKARYTDSSGHKVGALVSENITLQADSPVPEPTSLLLLGPGLVALGGIAWRKARPG